MSSATLMRLFGFARDYVVKLPLLPDGSEVFMQMRVQGEYSGPTTSVKYRAPHPLRDGCFCPVSRKEWERQPQGSFEERDAVRLLPGEGKGPDWYGLISIEPALGLQADIHVQKVQRDKDSRLEAKLDLTTPLRSGGIALTRRSPGGVPTQTNPQFCVSNDGDLFAEELHQFDRLDIGIDEWLPNGDIGTTWRTTMNRQLTHNIPATVWTGSGWPELNERWIDKFVEDLLGADLKTRRHELDATQLTEAALLGKTDKADVRTENLNPNVVMMKSA